MHLFQVSENNRKRKFCGFFFCTIKYSQISEFTWVSKGLIGHTPDNPEKIIPKKRGLVQPPPLISTKVKSETS